MIPSGFDIRKQLLKQKIAQAEKNLSTACLFNLIVYVDEKKDEKSINQLIDRTVEKFPCRIFFIEKEEKRNILDVEVSQRIISKEASNIVCDQIRIKASTNELSRVMFLILPYFVSDLPIYLFWSDNPTKDESILPWARKLAKRLIFTPSSVEFRKFLTQTACWPNVETCDLMDAEWALLGSWRAVFARTFDSEKSWNALAGCKKIKITYASNENSFSYQDEIAALYLTGWLAVKCDWTFSKETKTPHERNLIFKGQANTSAFHLISKKTSSALPGMLLDIEIETEEAIYSFLYDSSLQKAMVHIGSEETCELPFSVPLPMQRQGFTFIKELMYAQMGPDYFNMLKVLEQIPSL